MPLEDLSRVTDAVTKLIALNIEFKWGITAPDLIISPCSPDDAPEQVTTGNVVSVHLFHLMEDSFYKNAAPALGTGSVPQRHTPLSLILNYVITVHSETQPPDVLTRHRIMGYVLKTLHDFPAITAATSINSQSPFILANITAPDNDIELIMRPVGIEEVVNFWSSDHDNVPPLSAFFEARVIMLDPEPPEVLPGVVLSVGNYVFASTGPNLTGSRNELRFFPPGSSTLVRLTANPARVALFDGPAPFGDDRDKNNRLTLLGSSLSGDRTILILEREGEASRIDLTEAAAPGSTTNVDWAPDVQSNTIAISVQRTFIDKDTAATVALVPGFYAVRVQVVPLGFFDAPEHIRERASNGVAIAITPQIESVDASAAPVYVLRLLGDYVQYGPNEVEVDLAVGSEVLEDVGAAGTVSAGRFKRGVSGSFGTITFQLGILPAEFVPVQLVINGTTAPPVWVGP